jgi:hypothetical protein
MHEFEELLQAEEITRSNVTMLLSEKSYKMLVNRNEVWRIQQLENLHNKNDIAYSLNFATDKIYK